MKKLLLLAVAAGLALQADAASYKVDPDHSMVGFKVRHLAGKVSGRFEKFQGTFDYVEGNSKAWKVSATAEAASINTGTAKRDEHLRSADFFDVQKFPTLTFASKSVNSVKGDKGKLVGDLTIHGVTKPVAFDLTILGTAKDPFGGPDKAAFEATAKINRKEFGLNWSPGIETGGVLVGDDVWITLEIEGVKQP